MSWILNHEPAVRLGAFLGIFVVMALWELASPRRRLTTAKGPRWFSNLGITIVDTVVVRLLFPAAAVVTPDMHRVHHSVVPQETNSNFGFNLPWWDRLLGTYRAEPAAGQEGMTIGLEQYQEQRRQSLAWMLVLPFAGRTGRYPVGGGGDALS